MGRVFVLGASGFIGSALIRYLSSKNLSVTSVGTSESEVYLDLDGSHDKFLSLVENGDTLVFLAAVSAPDTCSNNRDYAERINVYATKKLITGVTEKGCRVIFASSDMVFGKTYSSVCDESSVCPFEGYGEMKANVEKFVATNQLVKVVRFSYVMGPGDKYTEMILSVDRLGENLEVFDGFERNIVALSDVTEGLYNLIANWALVSADKINFSGPECVSRWDMTQAFCEKFCKNIKLELVEASEEFWKARPKRIEMNSSEFCLLLERSAKTVKENLSNWGKK